jgi:hypothetical protein
MHLLGDLPTPSLTWGGIKLFWPLSVAIGGSGHIWWWNNYDIFLIIAGCCAINMAIIILYHYWKKPFIRYFPLFIFIGSFIAIFQQIDQRNINFADTGHTKRIWERYGEYEIKSLEIQKEILGEKLYDIMTKVDQKLTFYF